MSDALQREFSPCQALQAQAGARPDGLFLSAPASAELPYAPDGFAHRYGEALAHIETLRAAYAAAGYGHGACVALLLENRPEFFWHWLALNALGVSILPINPDLRVDDLAYQLSIAEPDLAVALPAAHSLIKASGDGAGHRAGRRAAGLPAAATRRRRSADDPCALLFTSGTTGKPKCCVLSNDYFLRIAAGTSQGGEGAMGEHETVLTPLPMFHMNALGCTVVGMILLGGALVPLDRFHARRWWRTLAGLRRDRRPLSRRHAGDPAEARPRGSRGDAQRPLRLRRRRRPAPPGDVRAPLRLSADRGLGHDRDRRAPAHLDGGRPRHVGARCIGARAGDGLSHRRRRTARTSKAARPGELLVRQRATIRAAASSPATSRTRPRPTRRGPAAGSTPATSSAKARTARCSSSTARRTSCAARARTSP